MHKVHRHYIRAFTLIEVLVVLAVIGLLVAILIPAIQGAREVARRTSCASNLRQISLAFASYSTLVGTVPSIVNGNHGFSPHSMILPQIEQTSLHNSINFNVDAFELDNETSRRTTVSLFLCPSDRSAIAPYAWTNYSCNAGYGYQLRNKFNGMFVKPPDKSVAMADVTDGLNSTAMVAEWVIGSGRKGVGDSLSMAYDTRRLAKNSQFEQFLEECTATSIESSTRSYPNKGQHFLQSSLGVTSYNHNLPINKHSCLNGGLMFEGAWSAGSRHGAGAHVAFADGHVQFVRDSVSTAVWRALATRAGGESLSSTQY